MHIVLDLKNNNDIRFGVNQNTFDKAWYIDPNKDYKLAVSLYSGKIELISFEMEH